MTEFIEQVFSTIFGDNIILATILIAIVPIIEIKGAIPFSMSTSIWGAIALSSTQALLYSLIGSCLIVPILALIYIPIINALKKTKVFKRLALKIEEKVNRSKMRIEGRAEKSNIQNEQEENRNLEVTGNGNEKVTLLNENDNNKTIINKNVTSTKNLKINNSEKIIINNVEKNNNYADNNTSVTNIQVDKSDIENNKTNLDSESSVNITEKPQTIKKYNKLFFIKLLSVFLFVSVPLPLTGVWTGTCVAVMLGLGFWWSCLAVISGNIVAGVLVMLVSSISGFDSIYIVYAVLAFIVVLLIFSLIKNLVVKKIKKNKIMGK